MKNISQCSQIVACYRASGNRQQFGRMLTEEGFFKTTGFRCFSQSFRIAMALVETAAFAIKSDAIASIYPSRQLKFQKV
ncbi:MAG: hypothetical protein DSM106950_45680 [Stigonema ocellatum SAG 48.90 = DSM 106950]|nr:hypothetical protein [Stigonema ocellatum SAG 48.90 = DSM 106950]